MSSHAILTRILSLTLRITRYWQTGGSRIAEVPGGCDGADLGGSSGNADGYVDIEDLMLFCDYWLERN